jgi:hypothetical protein
MNYRLGFLLICAAIILVSGLALLRQLPQYEEWYYPGYWDVMDWGVVSTIPASSKPEEVWIEFKDHGGMLRHVHTDRFRVEMNRLGSKVHYHHGQGWTLVVSKAEFASRT